MEGDARDQLQPQPWIVGKVGADPSSHHVFCVPDDFSGSKGGTFQLENRKYRHPYGRGISSCLQMARTVPSLISRWRGTLAILCNAGLNQILWAAPSRYKTQPWSRRWRSNSASFMLPLFGNLAHGVWGKGFFRKLALALERQF